LLWVLNLSDGRHSLLDISDRSGIDLVMIRHAADALLEHGLLKQAVL
jgi:aminopeptidase-like protein